MGVMRHAVMVGVAIGVGAVLTGCGSDQPGAGRTTAIGGDITAPVTMSANDLQGATVDLVVGQVLNITTGDLAVDSYSGEVADPSIATFEPGGTKNGASFNPGVLAVSEGQTAVTLTSENAGIPPLEFEVSVSSAP